VTNFGRCGRVQEGHRRVRQTWCRTDRRLGEVAGNTSTPSCGNGRRAFKNVGTLASLSLGALGKPPGNSPIPQCDAQSLVHAGARSPTTGELIVDPAFGRSGSTARPSTFPTSGARQNTITLAEFLFVARQPDILAASTAGSTIASTIGSRRRRHPVPAGSKGRPLAWRRVVRSETSHSSWSTSHSLGVLARRSTAAIPITAAHAHHDGDDPASRRDRDDAAG